MSSTSSAPSTSDPGETVDGKCRRTALGIQALELSRFIDAECDRALTNLQCNLDSNTLAQAFKQVENITLPAISQLFETSIPQLISENYPGISGSLKLLSDCFNLCKQKTETFLDNLLSKSANDKTLEISQLRNKLVDYRKKLEGYLTLFVHCCHAEEFRQHNFQLMKALETLYTSCHNGEHVHHSVYPPSAYVDYLEKLMRPPAIVTQNLIKTLSTLAITDSQKYLPTMHEQEKIFNTLFKITLPQIMTHWKPGDTSRHALPTLYQDILKLFFKHEDELKKFLLTPVVFILIYPEKKLEDQLINVTELLNDNRKLLKDAFRQAAKSATSSPLKKAIINAANKLTPLPLKPTNISKKVVKNPLEVKSAEVTTSASSSNNVEALPSVNETEVSLVASSNTEPTFHPSRLELLRDHAVRLKENLAKTCEESIAIFKNNPCETTQALMRQHIQDVSLPLINTTMEKEIPSLISQYYPAVPCSSEILEGCFNACKDVIRTFFDGYIAASQHGLAENPTLQKNLEEKRDSTLEAYFKLFQERCQTAENHFHTQLELDSCNNPTTETAQAFTSSESSVTSAITPPTHTSNALTRPSIESRIIEARKCDMISESELQNMKVRMIEQIKKLAQQIKTSNTSETIEPLLATLTTLLKDDLTSLIALYWCKSPSKQKTTAHECLKECLRYYTQVYSVIQKYLPDAPSPQALEKHCLRMYEEAWLVKQFEYANFGSLVALEKLSLAVSSFNGKESELLAPRTPNEYTAMLKETLQLIKTRIQQLSQEGMLSDHQAIIVSLLDQLPIALCEIIEKWSTENINIPASVGWVLGKSTLPIEVKPARHLTLHKVVWDAFCEVESFYRDLSMDPHMQCLQGTESSIAPQIYWEQRAKKMALTLEATYRKQAKLLQTVKKSRTTVYCETLAKEMTQLADKFNTKKNTSLRPLKPTSSSQESNKSTPKKKQSTKGKRKKITPLAKAVNVPKAIPAAMERDVPAIATIIKFVEESNLFVEPIITLLAEDAITEIHKGIAPPTLPLVEPCSLITADGIHPRILDLLRYLDNAYIVGGFPRSLFLKTLATTSSEASEIATLQDIDFVTTASHEHIMNLPKIFPEISVVKDRNEVKQGLYKLTFATKEINISIDIMQMPTLILAENAHLRDFTVNALYISIGQRGQLFLHYPLNHSLDDLRQRTVRPINDLSDIEQDPKRILRALRLVTQHHFVLEDSLHCYIKEQGAALLQKALQEQRLPIMDAIWKGFQQGDALRFYQILCEYHLFAVLFPEAYHLLEIEKNESFIEKLNTDLNYLSRQSYELKKREWLFCDVLRLPSTSPPRKLQSPPSTSMDPTAKSFLVPPPVPPIQPIPGFDQHFPQPYFPPRYFHFFSPLESSYQEPYSRQFLDYDTVHTQRSSTQSHHRGNSRRASRGGLFYGGSHAKPHSSQRSNSRYPARHPHQQESSPSSHAAPKPATAPPPTPRTK
jgi:hypothetical protein